MKDKEIQGMQIRICNACKQYKKCDKELCTMSGIVAKELSKFYQPKIDNSVVLSREEAERFRGQTINIAKVKSQARKETAEKCRNFVKEWVGNDEEGLGFLFDFENFITKQFGVEIKE